MRHILRKTEVLIFLVSIWIALTCNTAYWRIVAANDPSGTLPTPMYFASVASLTVGLIYLVLSMLAVGRITRVVLSLALIASAAAGYFTANFGILFDSEMLVNIIETNSAEAFELFSPSLVATVVLFGVIPAIVVWRFPLPKRRFPIAILHRGIAAIVAVGLIGGPLYFSQKEIVSLGRNHREIRHMIGPINVVSATYVYVRDRLESTSVFKPVALDAIRVNQADEADRPSVHVIIVGETARAASFSLDGYSRNTNPELQQHANVNFVEATSCGTATATSLPCMFSLKNRKQFDREASRNEENLLDIAARAGYAVYWVDNGNSCKGVCARVDSRDVHQSDVESICSSGDCFDEILVHELNNLLSQVSDDTLIVLHQLGSHGPAYYRRYPESFRVFLPDCRSPNLGDCGDKEIANSYDNTILYTDHVISMAIDALSAQSDHLDSSLIYMSDHGESLGEHNVYLHGMPYQFAPDEQIHIPMITWMSAGSAQHQELRTNCAGDVDPLPVSHDNLFHIELGLLGIETAVYDSKLDIYASCRKRNELVAANIVTAG